MSEGRLALASIATVQLGLPELPDENAVRRMRDADALLRDWNPDHHPRVGGPPNPGWFAPVEHNRPSPTRESSNSSEAAGSLPPIEIDFSDGYHDVVVDALIDGFKERGISAVKEPAIRFVGTSGVVIGFPDILVLPPGRKPEVIEVKTGSDPILTPMQALYIPYLQLGNHIYSTDSRITGLGLTPGQPFPQWK